MSDKKQLDDIDFLKNGPWDELYVVSEHWKSDLEFYRDDLRFLHNLIDKYLLWITKSENLDMVRELKVGLQEMNTRVEDLLAKVSQHRIQLGYMVEDPNRTDAGIIKTEHEHLEEEIAFLVKSFRANRKEVFTITEHIMDSGDLENIMEP